jgi:DNA-3-methyladenine glycosylase
VARDLLGRVLCRRLISGEVLKGRIVEVEAYHGITDQACHTYGGRKTPRTETMWGPAGVAYVYLIYGMHDCLNAVTRGPGHPEAVLIRALEPLQGHEFFKEKLPHLSEQNWLKGPGRLCRAMGITRAFNGQSLQGPELWIEEGKKLPAAKVAVSARIGVAYAGTCALKPLRFFQKNSEYVSGTKKQNQGSAKPR